MAEQADSHRLLIVIARDETVLDELVTGMLDVGITGATVVESKGLSAILRQDMPIFAGLAALLPPHTASRVILSITTHETVQRFRRYIEEMPEESRPIAVVIPVEDAFGLPDHR